MFTHLAGAVSARRGTRAARPSEATPRGPPAKTDPEVRGTRWEVSLLAASNDQRIDVEETQHYLLIVLGSGTAHKWRALGHLEDPGSNPATWSCSAAPKDPGWPRIGASPLADLTTSAKELRRPCPGRPGRPRSPRSAPCRSVGCPAGSLDAGLRVPPSRPIDQRR